MKSLLNIDDTKFDGKLVFGQWSGQLPHENKSYGVLNSTFDIIIGALKTGQTVYVGNSPGRNAECIAQFNSRYHGRSIRTIHILK